jgi:hypothetical protein
LSTFSAPLLTVVFHQTSDLKELTLRNSLHRFSNRSLVLLRPMGQHLVRLDLGGYKVFRALCSLPGFFLSREPSLTGCRACAQHVTSDALPFVLKSFPHLTLFDSTGTDPTPNPVSCSGNPRSLINAFLAVV